MFGRPASKEEMVEWSRIVGNPSGATRPQIERHATAQERSDGARNSLERAAQDSLVWNFYLKNGSLPETQPNQKVSKTPTQKTRIGPKDIGARKATPVVRSVDSRTQRALKGGKRDPEQRIDLHGCTIREAEEELSEFFDGALRANLTLVLVITGKGYGSLTLTGRPKGLLNQFFPEWLNRSHYAKAVRHYQYAHNKHGGTGAYYVLLQTTRLRRH